MPNHVKDKVRHNRPSNDWQEFIGGLQERMDFHERKAKELMPLIEDLKRLRDEGVKLPTAKRKIAGTDNKSIPA